MHRHTHDQVGTYYAPGGRSITTPDGAARTAMTEVGRLSTTRKGTTHIEEGNTDPPLRAVFIELKQETTSGLPAAEGRAAAPFPRAGATQVLDDDRVTVWDYTCPSGGEGFSFRPTRETVIVWLGAGTLRMTGGDGRAASSSVTAGTMRHMARGSNDTVQMVDGSPRAMFFELK
jgi:hypothetical protein